MVDIQRSAEMCVNSEEGTPVAHDNICYNDLYYDPTMTIAYLSQCLTRLEFPHLY